MRTLLQRTILDKEPNLYPIWLMRQAGRYMPEYMAIKNKSKSFLEMCLTPNKAAEITLQPIKAFDMDAAIIFSDILIIPYALGQKLDYTPGPVMGPFDKAIMDTDIKQFVSKCQPVYDAIKLTRQLLDPSKSLIGFAGAPWTLLRYMLANNKPDTMDAFDTHHHIQKLSSYVVEHLSQQIQAGCDIVQIFDSWAGDLGEDYIIDYCFDPTAFIVEQLKQKHPGVGVITFPRLIGKEIRNFTAWCEPDCVSLSNDVPFKYVIKHMGTVALQGGIDPDCLLSDNKETIMRSVLPLLRQMEGQAYVVNLAHGIDKTTPVENVEFMVEIIKRNRKKFEV